jgi:hypothetical protein
MNKNSKFNKTYNVQQSLNVSYLWNLHWTFVIQMATNP